MKTIKQTNGMMALLAAGTLLATGVGATVTNVAFSAEMPLDTRSLSQAVVFEDKNLDSRSYTIDWSEESILNTKKIVGTLLLLR